MNGRSWQRAVLEAAAVLLLAAVAAQLVAELLTPLLPGLMAAGCVVLVLTMLLRRR